MNIYVLLVLLAIVLILISLYNRLIRGRNRVDEAWSDIEVQLKRRHDLIPNLIETVKGYATHEKDLLEKVTQARAQAESAQTMEAKQAAEANLVRGISGIFAVAENYPDLKANQNFLQLQRDLTDTEDKIQAARRFYNGNVRDYNTSLQVFPTNLFARMFGFESRMFFDADEAETQIPKVSF